MNLLPCTPDTIILFLPNTSTRTFCCAKLFRTRAWSSCRSYALFDTEKSLFEKSTFSSPDIWKLLSTRVCVNKYCSTSLSRKQSRLLGRLKCRWSKEYIIPLSGAFVPHTCPNSFLLLDTLSRGVTSTRSTSRAGSGWWGIEPPLTRRRISRLRFCTTAFCSGWFIQGAALVGSADDATGWQCTLLGNVHRLSKLRSRSIDATGRAWTSLSRTTRFELVSLAPP